MQVVNETDTAIFVEVDFTPIEEPPTMPGLYFAKRKNGDIVIAHFLGIDWMQLGYSNSHQREYPIGWHKMIWLINK
jgi:hypothetical protein